MEVCLVFGQGVCGPPKVLKGQLLLLADFFSEEHARALWPQGGCAFWTSDKVLVLIPIPGMGYPMESMKVFTLNYHRTNDFLSPSWRAKTSRWPYDWAKIVLSEQALSVTNPRPPPLFFSMYFSSSHSMYVKIKLVCFFPLMNLCYSLLWSPHSKRCNITSCSNRGHLKIILLWGYKELVVVKINLLHMITTYVDVLTCRI